MREPNPWQPISDPIDLAHLGKLGEELNEAGAAVNRCIIQGLDGVEPITGKVNRERIVDMLAKTYLSAEELQINPRLCDALVELHGKFLRGEIPEEKFDMAYWGTPGCGTPGCIGGWAEAVYRARHGDGSSLGPFYPMGEVHGLFCAQWANWKPTTKQAAEALGHYLATGDSAVGWQLALGASDLEVELGYPKREKEVV